jgi:hypothetical protein
VLPAERTEKEKGRPSRSKPYERSKSPQPPLPKVRTIPQDELRKYVTPPNRAYVEVPVPPVILKRVPPEPSGPSRMDVDPKEPSRDKGKQRADPQVALNPRTVPSTSKTKKLPENVEVQDPKRANFRQKSGPMYRFASELQDRVKNDDLFERLMNQEVTVPLGTIFGTSYELNKQLTAAAKIHRIPTKQTNIVEYISDEEIEAEVMNTEVSSISNKIANLNVEDSGDDNTYVGSVEELADLYYQRMLESEFERAYGVADLNHVKHPPSFLAMVTAKVQGVIYKRPCTMLIDMGSELNIMTSEQADALELPIDPAGATWTLRGVSSHQVALEGLCRDVPITIGGIKVPHNFFIT